VVVTRTTSISGNFASPVMIEPTPEESDAPVDMSGAAISARLDMVSALYELGDYLAQARPIDTAPQSESSAEEATH
jgi:hypothetical protein